MASADGLDPSLGMVVGLVFVARMGVGKVMELGKVAAGRPDAWTGDWNWDLDWNIGGAGTGCSLLSWHEGQTG